jgi:TetR/AcrR family transcriptional regulator
LRKPNRRAVKSSTKTSAASVRDNSLNSKEAILGAAQKVFAGDGYDGASIPKIAKLARVAPPLVHYHFKSKENLWREAIALSLHDLHRDTLKIASATRSLAPLDRLRVTLEALTQHAARWPDNFVMIIAEARAQSNRFAWVHKHYTGPIFQEIVSILQEAKEDGIILDVDVDQLAFLLIGGVLVYFTVNPVVRENTDSDELDEICRRYNELIFALLKGILNDVPLTT